MQLLIRYLVSSIESIDGNRGSINQFIYQLQHKIDNKLEAKSDGDIQKFKKQFKEKNPKKFRQIEKGIYKKIFNKYKVLKWRMKISFMAFSQNMTVLELFLKAILKTYFHFKVHHQLKSNPFDQCLSDIIKGNCDLCTVIWCKNRHVLESELGFPKIEYSYWQDRFYHKKIT